MNIIAVDDERPALCVLEEAIMAAVPDCVLDCFLKAEDALAHARQTRIDVAFLDIKMAGMNGLTLAQNLKEIYGKTNILFVTGYQEYALDAYSVGPSGYIMKPAEPEKIALELSRLRDPIETWHTGRVRIKCFGNFDVFVDGKPLLFSRAKSKELLAYLVHKQGTAVSNGEIAVVLWEHADNTPSVQSNTRNAISHLLTTLREAGITDIVRKSRNSIAINVEKASCDFYDYLYGRPGSINTYTGEYMGEYSWAEFTAATLMAKL